MRSAVCNANGGKRWMQMPCELLCSGQKTALMTMNLITVIKLCITILRYNSALVCYNRASCSSEARGVILSRICYRIYA